MLAFIRQERVGSKLLKPFWFQSYFVSRQIVQQKRIQSVKQSNSILRGNNIHFGFNSIPHIKNMMTGSSHVREITPELLKRSKIGSDLSDKAIFEATFDVLCDDIINDLKSYGDLAPETIEWAKKSFYYNCVGGKCNRGLSVSHTLRHLVGDRPLTNEELFRSHVLGWCVELLQSFFLVADDIMDSSITRRGHPCWYRNKEVGMMAINDGMMIEMAIYKLLKRYFGEEKYYVQLLELFMQTTWQTEIGQLHDLITAPIGVVNLDKFSIARYNLIVKYKTAFYSFYLPVAEALIMAGKGDEQILKTAEEILLVMGEFFQIQDDYLDCYGAPEVIGKIGTDIEDNKCGWLIVQALDRVNAEQMEVLKANYGKPDPENVAAIKEVYKQLNMEKVFKDYEDKTYKELIELIQKTSDVIPEDVFMDFAKKIFKREK